MHKELMQGNTSNSNKNGKQMPSISFDDFFRSDRKCVFKRKEWLCDIIDLCLALVLHDILFANKLTITENRVDMHVIDWKQAIDKS